MPLKYIVRWTIQGAGIGVGIALAFWAFDQHDLSPALFAMGMGAVIGRGSR